MGAVVGFSSIIKSANTSCFLPTAFVKLYQFFPNAKQNDIKNNKLCAMIAACIDCNILWRTLTRI